MPVQWFTRQSHQVIFKAKRSRLKQRNHLLHRGEVAAVVRVQRERDTLANDHFSRDVQDRHEMVPLLLFLENVVELKN